MKLDEMNKKTLYFISTILIVVMLSSCAQKEHTLPFFNSLDYTPEWIPSSDDAYDDIHQISPFRFTDQNGKTITNELLDGKIYVADFFFTSCPSICPKLTEGMAQIQNKFLEDAGIKLISHSVMPWVDSVSVLKNYAINKNVIDGKWHLLTGNEDSIYHLARTAYFADEDFGFTNDMEDFLHTDKFILVDQKRRIRGIYSGLLQEEIDRIIEDIKILKME